MKSLNKWLVFLFVMLFCVITPLNLDMMEANSNGSQLEKNTQHKIEDYIETIKNLWGKQQVKLIRLDLGNDQDYYMYVPKTVEIDNLFEVKILNV